MKTKKSSSDRNKQIIRNSQMQKDLLSAIRNAANDL